MENTITRNEILSILSNSLHGDYKKYIPTVTRAAKENAEFLAHFISWNRQAGQIRDSKVAIPVITLSVPEYNQPEFIDNSLAHLAMLDPRNLVKAVKFHFEIRNKPGNTAKIASMVKRYLRYREANWEKRFLPAVATFKDDLHYLYRKFKINRSEKVGQAIFGGEKGQVKVDPARGTFLAKLQGLKEMPASEAVAFITANKLSFLTVRGFMGERCKEPDIMRVLVERMSPTELVSNAKWLEKNGIKNQPALRGAFEAAVTRASTSKDNLLKTTKAVEAVEDEGLKERLRGLQEKQIRQASVEGDWLVLGDKSGSMEPCIDTARTIAATLAKMVRGKIHLVFFDAMPRYMEVTGKTYDEILEQTKRMAAFGATSIGCGIASIAEKSIKVDGIVVVSDGEENTPPLFHDMYKAICQSWGKQVPVYFYKFARHTTRLELSMAASGIQMDVFPMGTKQDYYSIPNLAATMTTQRYGLVEKIYDTPLITLEMVFDGKLKNERRKKEYAH